jgi:hypothetical protein
MSQYKKMRQRAVWLFSLLACLLTCRPVAAQTHNWTIVVSPQRLDRFLNYPGSTLAPITKTLVEYYQSDKNVRYEDLFYSRCQPVGLRQYHSLDLIAGSSGIIRISNLGQSSEDGCAAANAAIRTFVDVFLTRAILLYIVVPKDSFDNLVEGMEHYGFCQPNTVGHPGTIVANITLVSEPPGRTISMFYAN